MNNRGNMVDRYAESPPDQQPSSGPRTIPRCIAIFIVGALFSYLCFRASGHRYLDGFTGYRAYFTSIALAFLSITALLASVSPTIRAGLLPIWRRLRREHATNEIVETEQWILLSGLRMFLALIVVAQHVSGWYPLHIGVLWALRWFDAEIAVIVFLIVSGYSIAASIERSAKGFYGRRVLRIYPLYWLAFGLALIPFLIYGHHFIDGAGKAVNLPNGENLTANFFLLPVSCFVGIGTLQTIGPAWSLAVEARLYVLAPLLKKMRWLLWPLILASAVYWLRAKHADAMLLSEQFIFSWAWLLGFWFYGAKNTLFGRLVLSLVGLVLIAFYSPLNLPLGPVTYIVGCVIFIVCRSSVCMNRIASMRGWDRLRKYIEYAGVLSYPVYIFHMTVFYLIGQSASPWRAPNAEVAVLLVLVVSAAADQLVDRPIHKLFKKSSLQSKVGADLIARAPTAEKS